MDTNLVLDYLIFGYDFLSKDMRLPFSRSMTPMTKFNEAYKEAYLEHHNIMVESAGIGYATCEEEYEDVMLKAFAHRKHIEAFLNTIDIILYDDMKVHYIIQGETKVHKMTMKKELSRFST